MQRGQEATGEGQRFAVGTPQDRHVTTQGETVGVQRQDELGVDFGSHTRGELHRDAAAYEDDVPLGL